MKLRFFVPASLFVLLVHISSYSATFSLPFSLRWELFLWENFYEKEWHAILVELTNTIARKTPVTTQLGQLLHSGIAGVEADKQILRQIRKYCPGGFILFKHNIESKEKLLQLISILQKESLEHCQIPLFFSIDQEGGRVIRIQDFVKDFPSAMATGQTGNPFYAWATGFLTAQSLSRLGIKLLFAPVADINNNPLNPVINTRSFGSDEKTVTGMVTHYIRGANITDAVSVLKHFPGHGDTRIDSHEDLPVITKSKKELLSFELVPFRKGIEEQARGVMVGHILFPEIDTVPSSLSKEIIQTILQKELGFRNLIITDALEMKAISKSYKPEEAALLSILAGNDIALFTAQNENLDKSYEYLLKHHHRKQLTEERIRMSFEKQIYFKLHANLFPPEILKSRYGIPETSLETYRKLYTYKQNLAEKIETYILSNYPDIDYRISFDGIRSLKKHFPGLHNQEKLIYFFYEDTFYLEEISRLQKDKPGLQVEIFPLSDLENTKEKIPPGSAVIIEIQNLDLASGLFSGWDDSLTVVGFTTGSPFQKITLKDNHYLIATFSPTTTSKKALIRKLFTASIPEANLILP